MAEDLIDHYVDRDGIKGDTKFILDEINKAIAAIREYNSLKPSFEAAKGYEATSNSVKKLANTQGELAASSVRLTDIVSRASRTYTDNATSINSTAAAAQSLETSYDELIKLSVANDVAAKNLAKSRKEINKAFSDGLLSANEYVLKLEEIKRSELELAASKKEINKAITVIQNPQAEPQEVPITFSTAELEEQKQAFIETGEAVNDYDREQAEVANSATAMGAAIKETSGAIKTSEADVVEITSSLDKYTGTLRQNLRLQDQNKEAIAGNKFAQREVLTQMADTNGATEQGALKLDALRKKYVELREEELILSEQGKELNLTIRNQVKAFTASEGSIDEMQAQLNLLQQSYEQLTEQERATPFGQELKKDIDVLEPKVKELEASLGKFSRNVGNYPKQFQGAFSVVKTELEKVQGLLVKGNFSGKELEELQRKEAALIVATENLGKEFTSTAAESRAFKQAGVEIGLVYGKDSVVVKEFTKEVVAGDSKIQEVNKSFNTAASGGSKFSNALSGVFGWLRNIANIIPGLGLGGLVAILLTPIAALGSNLLKFASNAKTVKGDIDSLRDTLEKTNHAVEESSNEYVKAASMVNELTINVKLAKEGLLDKDEVVNQYNESMGKVTGEVKSLNEVEDKLVKAGPAYIQMMLLKAAANFALQEAAKKAFEAQLEFQKEQEKAADVKRPGEAQKDKDAGTGGLSEFLSRGIKNQADATKKTADKEVNQLNSIAEKFQKDAAEIAQKFKFNFFDDGDDDKTKTQSEKFQEDLKAAFELRKRYLQNLLNNQKAIADAEGVNESVRVTSRKKQLEIEQQIIEEESAFELAAIDAKERKEREQANNEIKNKQELAKALAVISKNSAVERELIAVDGNDKLVKAELAATSAIIKIHESAVDLNRKAAEDTANALNAGAKESKENRIKFLQGLFEDNINLLKDHAEEESRLLLDQYKSGTISKEQYEEGKLDIENKFRVKSLQAEIDFQRDLINLLPLTPEERTAALKKIQELERKIREQGLKNEETGAGKSIAIAKKRNEKLKELGNELKGLAFDLLTGSVDREQNEIEEQIDLLEQKKQKDIEVANQTIANATDRANAIAVIEARSGAERERLERRKRQLDQERARYERIKNIADIIQSTAVAVVGALGAKPWGIQNIALAAIVGAIGAAQIARVLATPIPKFYGGKSASNKYEGLAMVGDGGRSEVIIREGKTYEITPNKPTQTFIGRDDVVVPDAQRFLQDQKKKETFVMPEAKQLIEQDFRFAVAKTGRLVSMPVIQKNVHNNSDVVRGLKSLERTVRNKREVTIKGISKRDLILKYGSNAWKFLND